ncbi:melanoma antigen recognized by T-cells 1 isoform X1 [Gopherus evgoodei]|uniref:Uncharacterized protein n=2 Tax=Gopherus agassizii TaxID=38772 RepID=A0A452IKY6_9SAUR|nr:melanoma antigen recognized by T-cells 1 isoform X1 [Gopherus evgoodei]XP_030423736.1 melanoma antigen recognized by T-cells 1 isoform X1 [Gopherus evgoodei]XP_030423738.1 melanoma antigen recognized by T-cells 1 isoform X1 [Gopherus evgoodei]
MIHPSSSCDHWRTPGFLRDDIQVFWFQHCLDVYNYWLPTRCDQNQSYKMPKGDHQRDAIFSRGKQYTYLAAEEAAGIGILVVVLAVLLIIGCWYYKRRCGYKNLRSKSSHAGTMRRVAGEDAPLDCKALLQEYSNFNSVVPDAPPAYDKVSADPLPPPYSP